MKNLYKRKRQEGFTIIEVMIVLAIAAVILLIVLLAVPALQRNSRNTGRNQDAAQLAAAINTCLANNNGSQTSCTTIGTNSVDYDLTKANQLTVSPGYNAGTPASHGTTTQLLWSFGGPAAGPFTGANCNGGSFNTTSVPSTRSFAIVWQNEGSNGGTTNRCISS